MKNLLISLFLTLTTLAFGNSQTINSNTMNVNAIIIKPLTVSHNGNIDFGQIVKNVNAFSYNKVFTIDGTPGQKIEFKINDTLLNNFNELHLTNTDPSKSNTISMWLENRTITSKSGTLFQPILDSDGKFIFKFDAKLVPGNIEGQYAGALNVSVRYN